VINTEAYREQHQNLHEEQEQQVHSVHDLV
jgi:hypothetical protein